jgi:hypothetical protein
MTTERLRNRADGQSSHDKAREMSRASWWNPPLLPSPGRMILSSRVLAPYGIENWEERREFIAAHIGCGFAGTCFVGTAGSGRLGSGAR